MSTSGRRNMCRFEEVTFREVPIRQLDYPPKKGGDSTPEPPHPSPHSRNLPHTPQPASRKGMAFFATVRANKHAAIGGASIIGAGAGLVSLLT